MTSLLLQRARDSGRCAPSLLVADEEISAADGDGFSDAVMKLLDGGSEGGFRLAPESSIGDDCASLLQNLASADSIPADSDEAKKAVLEQRRSIVLAVVGGTPTDSPSLSRLLSRAYLDVVKTWLDDILSGSVGGVDLLLHLLTNIVDLPVTKSVVKESGMGKAIGSIEKHRIVVGTPNESAIKERVQQVKDAWHASVKARKSQGSTGESKAGIKRPNESEPASPSPAKRTKSGDDAKKPSSFSSLLKTLAGADGSKAGSPSKKSSSPDKNAGNETSESGAKAKASVLGKAKTVSKRVKWSDHFGGTLTAEQLIDGEESSEGVPAAPVATDGTAVSWSDRKKRDRIREKELLAKAKKSKLLDDFEDDVESPRPSMQPTMAWRVPSLLPDRPDVTKAQLTSAETSLLNDRMSTVPKANYMSEYDVANSPAPLTDVEQALDMTSQASAVIQPIPFFVPQQQDPVVDTSNSYATTQIPVVSQPVSTTQYAPPMPVGGPITGATPDFVQALGLPMFLVGQDIQALQTLASSPSLLSSLVGPNGMYDQARLMSLVQTLSGSNANPVQQRNPTPAYQQPPPGIYGPSSATSPPYGQAQAPFQGAPARNGFRGSSSSEGNLHISGYGAGTTESDIIAMFAPYVQVDEVVMKGTFAFVNTSDPANAQHAKDALTGTLLGGMPVRINPAQRKNRETSTTGGPPTGNMGPPTGNMNNRGGPPGGGAAFGAQPPPAVPVSLPGMPPSALPPQPAAVNVDAVRDDRGNPATKNLFVAGYGPGTTEQQIRDIFGQHVHVVGVVLKGSFTFVNTTDRTSAVRAREGLKGANINGGPLRINFAKETGRLGTSFDLTYGPNTGPNGPGPGGPGQRPPPPPNNSMSYYGRG